MIKSLLITFCTAISILANSQSNSTTVYFDFDKANITSTARNVLDTILASGSDATISIYGHCDQIGSTAYNHLLSIRRAEAVRNYLVNKGLNKDKISIKGFGEDQPVINRMDEESRKANRRVTIDVVEETTALAEAPPKQTAPKVKQQTKEKLIEQIKDTTTKAGDNIVLKNINFYGGRQVFLPEAYPALYELLETMNAIPTLEIEIQGHICCQDGEQDGMDNDTGEPWLSVNRARAVYQFLIRRGIDKNRMTYKGMAHKFPLIPVETTEAEKTMNRRVEIKIIKK